MRPLARLLQRKAFSSSSVGRSDSWSQLPFWVDRLGKEESLEANFETYVREGYKANGPVFACILARLLVFSEARFQFQRIVKGRPGELYDDPALALLNAPSTTNSLLSRMEQNSSLAGNYYGTSVGAGASKRIRHLRPDWVKVLTGSPTDDPFDLNADILAYAYMPGGRVDKAELLLPSQVVHYAPIPDPLAQWRGMSWLTPVIRELQADTAATKHKLMFFKNGAAANFVVSYSDTVDAEAFGKFVEMFKASHAGVDNAYKTIHVGGGADITTVGKDLQQLDFKVTQGAGETRIAAAAGVPPIIVGLSEGLQSATYSNYGQARRRFADGTIRPLWRTASAALATLAPPPADSRLWVDTRDVSFLREDEKDAAEILGLNARALRQLLDAGWEAESAKAAITAGDLGLLTHTGLFSVQLQAPGSGQPPLRAPAADDMPPPARRGDNQEQ